jgi:ABC-2 type transport system ATP-binding protein
MMDAAIEAYGLTKTYGEVVAVEGLDLIVRRGEIFGFLGPNGAGKSTTIRMLAGILRPTRGRARVAGYDLITQPIEAKRRIGYLAEEPYVYEKLSGGSSCVSWPTSTEPIRPRGERAPSSSPAYSTWMATPTG